MKYTIADIEADVKSHEGIDVRLDMKRKDGHFRCVYSDVHLEPMDDEATVDDLKARVVDFVQEYCVPPTDLDVDKLFEENPQFDCLLFYTNVQYPTCFQEACVFQFLFGTTEKERLALDPEKDPRSKDARVIVCIPRDGTIAPVLLQKDPPGVNAVDFHSSPGTLQ